MKRYCIDYRVGSLGNTVLTHTLYASEQVDIDLQNFFSCNGNAHKIREINSSVLTATHLIEHPDENLICVLELTATGWYELLRCKMDYSKRVLSEPTIHNYRVFFQPHYEICKDLWVEFYNDLKDPSWPECEKFGDIQQLPYYIQNEIKEKWNPPNFDIDSEFQLVEFLVFSYYDRLTNFPKLNLKWETYDIGKYLEGELDQLINLSRKLNWVWNKHKSQDFYLAMIENNKPYLAWMNLFKQKFYTILDTNELDWELSTWEFSYMLAKLFFDLGKNPREVKWQNLNCFFDNKNLKLTQLLG